MSTSDALKQICTEARPLIEQHLDIAVQLVALRELATVKGLEWSSVKSLLKASIEDERDENGDGKRVRKIVEKAEFASAYADMLGLNINEGNFSPDNAGSSNGRTAPFEGVNAGSTPAPATTYRGEP